MKEDEQFGYRGDRVRAHTTPEINKKIDKKMKKDVQAYTAADPEAIQERIRELELEWDIERILEMNASALAFLGVLVSRWDKRWLFLPTVVLSFLFLHAVQGWCPPVPLLRRLGIRTTREIEAEKYALKSLQKRETSQVAGTSPYLSVGIV